MTRPFLPLRLRFTLCLIAAVYPVLTGLNLLIMPLTLTWPLPARTALLAPIMVLTIVYAVIPTVHRIAGRWIQAGAPTVEA